MGIRAKQLELEYKEDTLAARERDYKAVREQLRIEGDAPRQNQLKDQLATLKRQIEQLEQEIAALRQAIQREKTESSLEALVTILQTHESRISEMLTVYQRTVASWAYSTNLEPTTSQAIITELLRVPKGQSSYSAVEQFVASLVSFTQHSPLLMALQHWGERQISQWREVLEWVKEHQEQQAQQAQPVVMVVINRSDEISTQQQEGNYYHIQAWLIQDKEQYKKRRQGYTAINLTGPSGEETYLIEDLSTKAPQVLLRLLRELSNEFVNEPEIHVFLPLELMNQDVDCWLLNDGCGRSKPLGHEYKVVLRCVERVSRNYRQRPRWVKKWKQHQSLLEEYAFNVFTAGDDNDLDELSYALEEVVDTVVGLKITQAPTQVEPDGLFGIFLQSGLPLAVWGRCNLLESTNAAELDRVLKACYLERLPDKVKQERRYARNKEKAYHIGHHLSLLWDDPDLVPPRSA